MRENQKGLRIKGYGLSLALTLITYPLTLNLYAQSISSTELIQNAKDYDGKNVVYEGEVIGEVMVRGKNAWINVNDGKTAIGIWVENSLLKDITYAGSYRAKGDWVEVKGVFHRACLEHGGDLDIHAESIVRIKQGQQVSEAITSEKKKLAVILFGVLCLVLILQRFGSK